MLQLTPLEPVDYLVIGHLTRDITPDGPRLGGTAAYAALTARALGLRVGMVTSWGAELPLGPLRSTPVVSFPTDQSTTFENVETEYGRVQYIRHLAPSLDLYMIPEPWRGASIVHLAPVAQEVEPSLIRNFPSALIGITPQGWLRSWDSEGRVHISEWPEAPFVLERAGATVISLQDVGANEDRLYEMTASSRVLAVTEGAEGSRVYWQGDVRRFSAPSVEEVDPIGAGDIFAAAFFVRLYTTRDPWEAARFANQLAAISVTRPGLAGIPTSEEIEESMVEIF
jgi:sugar/nucleoside kinase (ribokinase family)